MRKLIALCAVACFGLCGAFAQNRADSKSVFVKVASDKKLAAKEAGESSAGEEGLKGFECNGKKYKFMGMNFWYGAILASEGEGGNLERLRKELDLMKKHGMTNVRVLAGGDGNGLDKDHIRPTLQTSPGVYNDTILRGLDRLMVELGKRGMKAVVYLTNSWEWSGGFSQYLEWNGHGKALLPSVDGYNEYCGYVSAFARDRKAQEQYLKHVKFMVSRKNSITGKNYSEDPALMAWEICNEPRPFSEGNKENKDGFARWIADAAALIKSIDKNHLVTTGTEGKYGCESDYSLLERIHGDNNIDYLTIHVWPKNWGWVGSMPTEENLPVAFEKSKKYVDEHVAVAKKLNIPLVMEEFGYPRDGMSFKLGTPTNLRDKYYDFMLDLSKKNGLAGVNVWGWGGTAKLNDSSNWWQKGDDYTCDPAHEQQGLYSVFESDASTVKLLEKHSKSWK